MAPSLFDDHGYQDVPNREVHSTDLSAADDRTLRMATPRVDTSLLDALVRFQESFLSHAGSDRSAQALATAHRQAQDASGLDAKTLEQGVSLLRAFGGRRWTARKLDDKLRQLESHPPSPETDELRARLRGELVKQEQATDALARRYGEDTLALLKAHEARLVDLHTRMTGLFSQG